MLFGSNDKNRLLGGKLSDRKGGMALIEPKTQGENREGILKDLNSVKFY